MKYFSVFRFEPRSMPHEGMGQADSREGAIDLAQKFLNIAGDGECEMHQIMEQGGQR